MIDLKRAKFDKRLPKNLFKVTFEDIDTIRWLYKIAHTTADFIASIEIKEIEIVEVTFKNGKTNTNELATLQKASPHPTLYKADEKYYIVIAGETLMSDKPFVADDTLNIEQRSSLLTDLWHDLTKEFLPIEQRLGESTIDTVTRYKALQAIDREIESLQRKVDNEKQTNKRYEYNEQLKRLRAEREEKSG